ncbi:polysaccharide lyase [Aliiglaciecola sp. LCG003]|uniref:polysaccharide lyase n=1 Tax=Aliiglaciecola sp. LCG003 TaxID=3053655 RepID=UPI0025734F05|nr:polysaccharide lyase [Aliiglaciecola sp. LCG003]WJG09740.1 polysaccharide lyase [Aliiglaciecola sp. LCG003]
MTIQTRKVTKSKIHQCLYLALMCFLMQLSGCAKASNSLERSLIEAVAPQQKVKDILKFEINSVENVRVIDGDNPHIGLYLAKNNSKLNNGVRAELSLDYPFEEGETVTYHWKMKIPADFKSDAPRNRWWSMAQWHDQPNRIKKETWKNHASLSPPVALYYGVFRGKDVLSVHYKGLKPSPYDLIELKRDQWTTIDMQIKWSQKGDGWLKVFVNGSADPVVVKKGPNMHNDYQHYLKLGMYRDPSIETENWVFIDELMINP